MNHSRILAALTLLGLLGCCTALQCYVCNSHFNKDCNDMPVPDKYLLTCDSSNHVPLEPSLNDHSGSRQVRVTTSAGANFTFCRKVVQKIPIQNNGALFMPETTRIVRSCGYVERDSRNICKWANNHGVQILMCECNTKACNSAPSKFIPAIIYLVIVSVAAFIFK